MRLKGNKNLNIMEVLGEHLKNEFLNRGRGAHFFNQSLRSWKKVAGFTLVELLIVIGITAALSVVGVGFYANQQKVKILENTAQEIASYLKYTQQKSVSQEQGLQWGIHFDNPSSGSDFYALYTGTTYSSPIETKYLPAGIEFQTPSSGNSVNTSFSKLTGLNYSEAEQEIIIRLISNQIARVIRTTANGLITSGEGEKGYWKFDKGSGTTAYDSTIYHNNGTLYNSPTWQSSSNCVSGSCLSFNGSNNYVNCGTNPTLHFEANDSLTLMAWFKRSGVGETRPRIIAKRNGGQDWYELYLDDPDGSYIAGAIAGDYGVGGGMANAKASWPISDGIWYHAAVVRNTATDEVYLYVNGKLEATVTDVSVGEIDNIDTPLYINGYGSSASNFNGLIDEVRIYNRALSPVEILQHYNSRS